MEEVPSRIEHTVLGPTTTWGDVTAALDVAVQYGTRACVPPCYVEAAGEYAPGVALTTVIGFPHGQHTPEIKSSEADAGWSAGAAEVDVVANLGRLRAGEAEAVREELTEIVAAVPVPVKVIVEAPLLGAEELAQACQAAVDADAEFLKTATGFTEGGATVEDVHRMSEYLPVKASGGIQSWTFAAELFEAGATRIGTSSGEIIVTEYNEVTGDG